MSTRYAEAGDDVLIGAVAERREDALHAVYDLHGGAILGVARGVLRNQDLAEDVTQEVLLRLWRNPGRFDPGRGSLRAFLIRDAHGRAVDLLRSEVARRRREERDRERSSDHEPGPESEVWERLRSDEVLAALESLPETERTAVVLAYYEGLSYREVAVRLGEPEGTIKSRIRSGLHRLHAPLRRAGLVET